MRTHTSDKPFACCKCPKRFRDASNMKVHLRTHTKCKPYKCDYCDCAFANYSSLKYHHKTNHAAERSIKYTRLPEPSIVDSSSIRCSINGVNCNRLENAVSSVLVNTVHRHAKDKVANIVSVNGGSAAAAESPTTVTCSYCESDFSSSEALTTHCLEVHVFQKLQQCKSCFTDLIRYVMDYSCCHAPGKPTLIELNNDANAVDQQSCETYDDDDDVDDDNDNEIGETRTAEQPPGSVGVKISAKKQRARPKVGNNQYKCWHCHSVFASLQTLREHRLQTHSHEKPYKCNICDKAYKRPDGLEIHMRSHTGEKPYSCPECHKAFAMSNSLKLHLQTHNSSKMFLCKDCGKALASAHTLRLHARLHTGEKPFKCLLCEKTFPRSDAMKSHLRSHRSDKQCSDLLAQMAGGVEKVSHLSTDAGEAVVHIPLFDAGLYRCFAVTFNET
jgi:KRAB domain-containing zinc finger protein